MNKDIKYIIEKIQKFNPVDYQDDEHDIIDTDTVETILDPMYQLLNLLSTFKWERKKQWGSIKGISYENYISIRDKIINMTKNRSESSNENAKLYFNEDMQTIFLGFLGIEEIYKYKLAILDKNNETDLNNLSNWDISSNIDNGIVFEFEIHKTKTNNITHDNINSSHLFLRPCCLINPELHSYKYIGTVNKQVINKLIEKFINE